MAVLVVIVGLFAFGEISSAICPACKKYGLKFDGSNETERSPVVLYTDDKGQILLRGSRVKTEIRYKCKHCDHSLIQYEERVL
jgi:hypothetical protein